MYNPADRQKVYGVSHTDRADPQLRGSLRGSHTLTRPTLF